MAVLRWGSGAPVSGDSWGCAACVGELGGLPFPSMALLSSTSSSSQKVLLHSAEDGPERTLVGYGVPGEGVVEVWGLVRLGLLLWSCH